MRWPDKRPINGDTRIVKRFIWIPTTLNGQTRWLEIAKIEQKYQVTPPVLWELMYERWINKKWINK